MKIEVTQDLITQGTRNCCNSCPVALAIKHAFPGARFVEVAHVIRWLSRDGIRHEVPLPKQMRQFIDNFDRGYFVEPRTFDLPVTP